VSDDNFLAVRMLDNFYQTSVFFPMPVVLVCTIAETGQMNLGPYSLCFPYSVAGDRYQMVFNCRDNSNTGINLRRTHRCSLNFIPDNRRYLRNCVMIGYPGETTDEKVRNSIFTLQPSSRLQEEREPGVAYPDIVGEALQVLLIVAIAVAMGLHSASGFLGIVMVVFFAFLWGMAFAGYAAFMALRTKNAAAAQASTFAFFPLIFLTSTFVPREYITAGWLKVVAVANPTTYVFDAMRSLLIDGWSPRPILLGLAVMAAFATLTGTLALTAARRATRLASA